MASGLNLSFSMLSQVDGICYTDIGANLCNPAFSEDCTQVIERAKQANINRILVTSSDLEETKKALLLCRQHPKFLFASAGIHPHQAQAAPVDFIEQLKPYLAQPEFKAIGEIGLDYNRNYSPQQDQEAIFEAQLELALAAQLPLFLHERDAGQRFREIFRPYHQDIAGGVLHCFSGGKADLHQYLDLGLYIGITGWICDPKRGLDLQKIVKHIPDDRLLIETDAPFLPPKTLNPVPQRNEPAWLPEVARTIARCRQQTLALIAKLSHNNAEKLFAFDS